MDELSPVQFEHHREALGIGEPAPRLSWRAAPEPGWRQAVADAAGLLGGQVFLVESPESVLVPWPAAPLRPREAKTVRVRVTGADGSVSDWSDPSVVERGLDAGAWQATLIEPSGGERGPAALLLRKFTVPGPVAAARLYDATRERPGWSRPGFDDTGWEPVRLGQLDPGVLVMPDGPHGLVQLLGRPAHPAARQRRAEHARQLHRRADRLPAA